MYPKRARRRVSGTFPKTTKVSARPASAVESDWFIELFRRGLEASGHTVKSAAEAADVNRPIVSYWLNGKRPIRSDYLARLFDVVKLGPKLRKLAR